MAQEVEKRYGEPSRFTPWPVGAIPADRLEAFLAIRAAMAPQRERLAGVFGALPISDTTRSDFEKKGPLEKLRTILGISRGALGIAPAIGDFFRARSQALLDTGMGMGEYEYLYVICYYSWLGHSAAEGPHSQPGATSGSDDPGSRSIDSDVGRRLHTELLAMLRNQAGSLPEGTDPALRAALSREIEAMEDDPIRPPWREGLPPAMAASLEPFKERLAAAWSPMTNPFELAVNRRTGRYSFQAD